MALELFEIVLVVKNNNFLIIVYNKDNSPFFEDVKKLSIQKVIAIHIYVSRSNFFVSLLLSRSDDLFIKNLIF